jgi:hypothetical protein
MNETPWLSYIVLTIVVAFITAIFTEKSIMKRIQYSEGIVLSAGKCRLKPGYGQLATSKIDLELMDIRNKIDDLNRLVTKN